MLNHGDKVNVYDMHGKIVGRGAVWGRNVFKAEFPQYLVMPEGAKSLTEAYGYPAHQWIPASRVRKAYVPDKEIKPIHIKDEV